MIVGVDGRGLRSSARGVARVTTRLCEALAAAGTEVRVLLPEGVAAPAGTEGVVDGRGSLAVAAAALRRRPAADLRLGCDVLWAPAPRPLAPARAPLVLHVHDRSWEERPRDFGAYERLFHRVARPRALARRAARVVFDTRAVRDDVVARWGLDPARTAVVPLGVDVAAAGDGAAALPAGLPERFLLLVAAADPRKGADVLRAAFARARAAGLADGLVLVGPGGDAGAAPGRGPGDGVRELGAVSDEALAALYARATALVLPSFLEGYGLTPLEARAHGTPAIVSDLPVLREVLGGDGVAYVPPGDVAALAAALAAPPAPPASRAVTTWPEAAAAFAAVLAEAAG